jgi:hypothetical protein
MRTTILSAEKIASDSVSSRDLKRKELGIIETTFKKSIMKAKSDLKIAFIFSGTASATVNNN